MKSTIADHSSQQEDQDDVNNLLQLCSRRVPRRDSAPAIKTQESLGQHCHEMSSSEETSTDETSTIIIGGGVIGLCTAYHLAKATAQDTTVHRHKIIVIEDAGKVFSAASSANTGILSYSDFEEELRDLARYSYEQWETLVRGDADFNRQCGYREGANIALRPGSGEGHELIPDWVHTKPE